MIREILTFYNPWKYSQIMVYMLQNTEYQVAPYLAWYWRTQKFSGVMYRRTLTATKATRLLRLAIFSGYLLQVAVGISLMIYGLTRHHIEYGYFGAAIILGAPIVWTHLVVLPLAIGRYVIIRPSQKRMIQASQRRFADCRATKIAIAGSYGKTSMKELLVTVLSEGKKVAATPGNKNVALSHAAFAEQLTGDEDIVIIEYGEGRPGDVTAFAQTTQPDYGIITGLAPAHLDQYKTLEAAGQDILSLADYLHHHNVYVSGDSPALQPLLKAGDITYSSAGVLDWTVKNIRLSATETRFELSRPHHSLILTSSLLGQHQVGPLSLAAVLGLTFGLTEKQVTAGIAKTKPYEHRMQPYTLNGATIIDDTYNGNIEGVRAGTALLKTLEARRKIYVTPGLVDQGNAAQAVHVEMGGLIARACPDQVVLMQNSTTVAIREGLQAAGYSGEVIVETRPLNFYTNIGHFVAAGDLMLLQNDWPDNYA